MRRNIAWLGGSVALLLSLRAASLPAQNTYVLLELRPRVGDTLHLRLDQTIEISRLLTETTVSEPDLASLVILARIIVESADDAAATVLTIIDSVRIKSSDAFQTSSVLKSARSLPGQRLRFRVATDGSVTFNSGDALVATAVAPLFSQLPSTMPRDSLAPGAAWNRSVDIPVAVTPQTKTTATLNARFRFDSLSRSGDFAHLSVKGRVMRSGPQKGAGAFVQTSGEVSGDILIDRRMGWISDARSVVALETLVSAGPTGAPLRARVKITQWMRVL